MLRRFSVNFALFSMTLDAALALVALELARRWRPAFNPLPGIREIPGPVKISPWVYLLVMVVWIAVFLRMEMYNGQRYFRARAELAGLLLGTFWAAFTIAGVLYLTYREISRFLFLFFVALTFFFQATWRGGVRLYWRWRKQAFPDRRILVVGEGPLASEVWRHLSRYTSWGLKTVGLLSSTYESDLPGPYLGEISAIRQVIRENGIDEVILALSRPLYAEVRDLVERLQDLPVKVWLVPDYYSLALHKARLEDFADLPLMDLRAPALTDHQRMIKRVFDLTLLTLLLPFALPLMGVVALAIRLEGPGPVLLRQERIGENGRPFSMLKFRTMVPNAERLQHLVQQVDEEGRLRFKFPDDPRVTRLGRFLRHTSLDELPQLFNVLRGEMSLVGPRPELPEVVEQYEPWQRKRLTIPPGITGWWQISGRSDRPMHLHTEDDLYYIQHYSLFLDIQILLRTVGAVLSGKGAY